MNESPNTSIIDETPNFAPRLYGIGLLLVGIIVVGTWLVGRYSDLDLARDMQGWQEKLNLVAESRTAEVDHWVAENFKELRTLADNPSLQLYMTELQTAKESEKSSASGEPSQKSYLRNLLLFTAQRSGFAAAGTNNTIPANVQQGSKSALAIIDTNNNVLVSTLMQPATKELMLSHVKQAEAAHEALIDIRKDKDGTAYLGFIVPIFSIQGDHNVSSQIGHVVGIKTLDTNLFGLLKHPGVTEQTLETILVRTSNDKMEYLSPLQDSTEPLGKIVPYDTTKLAEASLVQSAGNFVSQQKDYRDKQVLATSRTVSGTPWTLIVKIDRSEALSDSDQRRGAMKVFCFLLIAIVVAIISAIWWRAHSKRSMMMSSHFQKLATIAQAQERLLRLVADNQPEPIYILDSTTRVRFANQQAASSSHMSVDSMIGKALADIRGSALSAQVVNACKSVLASGSIMQEVMRTKHATGKTFTMRNSYVPLAHIPVASLPNPTPGVLVVEQDITEVIHEREMRLRTSRQLIETLVTLVDKRDPFAAYHSKLVSQIAYEIALEMELDTVTIETASKAGVLMNIGKILVPTELLTKTTQLTSEEKRIVHEAMNSASELLSSVSFDGPVAETLRQWQEKWDGTGPLGLKGEDILITARIIAVANAFVGMISPRAWRTAIEIEAANKFLLDQSESHFDRRVVVAMVNFIENHNGRQWIAGVISQHQDAA